MGWKGVTVMDQRIRFLSDYLEGLYPLTELCQHVGISRKTLKPGILPPHFQ